MIAKICVALLTLNLALAQGCSTKGGEGQGTNTSAPVNERPAAAASVAPTAPAKGKADACALLTSEDIKAVQGEAVKDARGSEQTQGALSVAQCFYTTTGFNKSVNMSLTQKNPDSSEPGGPREVWEKQFSEADRGKEREEEGRERGRAEKRREGSEREEDEEGRAQLVEGIGDEAFWTGNRKIGVLFVLKGDLFLRVSIGGTDSEQVKIEKMKELAKRALARL